MTTPRTPLRRAGRWTCKTLKRAPFGPPSPPPIPAPGVGSCRLAIMAAVADSVARFMDITGAEAAYAITLLSEHGGDLDLSIASHFAMQEAAEGGGARAGVAVCGGRDVCGHL